MNFASFAITLAASRQGCAPKAGAKVVKKFKVDGLKFKVFALLHHFFVFYALLCRFLRSQ